MCNKFVKNKIRQNNHLKRQLFVGSLCVTEQVAGTTLAGIGTKKKKKTKLQSDGYETMSDDDLRSEARSLSAAEEVATATITGIRTKKKKKTIKCQSEGYETMSDNDVRSEVSFVT